MCNLVIILYKYVLKLKKICVFLLGMDCYRFWGIFEYIFIKVEKIFFYLNYYVRRCENRNIKEDYINFVRMILL